MWDEFTGYCMRIAATPWTVLGLDKPLAAMP